MADTTIHETLLEDVREYVISRIDHGRYMMGGAWHDAAIDEKGKLGAGTVYAQFYFEQLDGAESATAFELLDASGNTLVSREEEILFPAGISALVVRFRIAVTAAAPEGE